MTEAQIKAALIDARGDVIKAAERVIMAGPARQQRKQKSKESLEGGVVKNRYTAAYTELQRSFPETLKIFQNNPEKPDALNPTNIIEYYKLLNAPMNVTLGEQLATILEFWKSAKQLYQLGNIDPTTLVKIDLLGQGTFGKVYKVRDGNDNLYALKELDNNDIFTADPQTGIRYMQNAVRDELVMISKVNPRRPDGTFEHRHVVGYVGSSDSWVSDSNVRVAMILTEFIDGVTLRAVATFGAPRWDHAERIARELFEGLAFIHSKGVAHRDIKPENIMIERSSDDHPFGRVVIVDLGLSCFVDQKLTEDFLPLLKQERACRDDDTSGGTYLYLSPEIAKVYTSPLEYSATASMKYLADVWAASMSFCEAISGIPNYLIRRMIPKIDRRRIQESIAAAYTSFEWEKSKLVGKEVVLKAASADLKDSSRIKSLADIVSNGFLRFDKRPSAQAMVDSIQEFQKAVDLLIDTDDWTHLEKQHLAGSGAFGEVFKAYDSKREKFFALKEMQNFDQMRDELIMLSSVNPMLADGTFANSNVAGYIGSSQKWKNALGEPRSMILSEWINGQDMVDLLRTPDDRRVFQAKRMARELFSGLAFIHSKGVAHRDIKPKNVMVERGSGGELYGRVVIVDLGIGCFVDQSLAENVHPSLKSERSCEKPKATISYLSPEIAYAYFNQSIFPYDWHFKADVWAAALTLWNFWGATQSIYLLFPTIPMGLFPSDLLKALAHFHLPSNDSNWQLLQKRAIRALGVYSGNNDFIISLAKTLSEAFLHRNHRPSAQQIVDALVLPPPPPPEEEPTSGPRLPKFIDSYVRWMIPESWKTQRYRLLREEKLWDVTMTPHTITLPIFGKPTYAVTTARKSPWPYGDVDWVMGVRNIPRTVFIASKEKLDPRRLKEIVDEIQTGVDLGDFSFVKAFSKKHVNIPHTIDRQKQTKTPYQLRLDLALEVAEDIVKLNVDVDQFPPYRRIPGEPFIGDAYIDVTSALDPDEPVELMWRQFPGRERIPYDDQGDLSNLLVVCNDNGTYVPAVDVAPDKVFGAIMRKIGKVDDSYVEEIDFFGDIIHFAETDRPFVEAAVQLAKHLFTIDPNGPQLVTRNPSFLAYTLSIYGVRSTVYMPDYNYFRSPVLYFFTLFHEFGHGMIGVRDVFRPFKIRVQFEKLAQRFDNQESIDLIKRFFEEMIVELVSVLLLGEIGFHYHPSVLAKVHTYINDYSMEVPEWSRIFFVKNAAKLAARLVTMLDYRKMQKSDVFY